MTRARRSTDFPRARARQLARAARVIACALISASTLGACSPAFDGFEFEVKNTPPYGYELRADGIDLPVGYVVVAGVTPLSASSQDYDSDALIELRSPRTDVVDIYVRAEPNEFAFVGVSEGEACVEVYIDDSYEGCVPTKVAPAEADL